MQIDGTLVDDDNNNRLITILAQSLLKKMTALFPNCQRVTQVLMLLIRISTEGVISFLEGLDSFKACGPDNIPTRFIKETAIDLRSSIIDSCISGISEAE